MNREEQDRAWACLSSEAREYVKFTTPLTEDVTNTLNYLFGEHNILSRTEPEEMLMVERTKVISIYSDANCSYLTNYTQITPHCSEVNSTVDISLGKMQALKSLFGGKCLPDREQSKPTDKVLSALEHYRVTATPSQKAADLNRLEKECLSDKEPMKIDAADSLIEMAKDEMNINMESKPKFNKGDEVVIIYGKHKGFRGIIQEYSEDDDTWAVIINGYDYPINYAAEWIEPYAEENENKQKKTKELSLSDKQLTENQESIVSNGETKNETKELNLCELLKRCRGEEFYSHSYGVVILDEITFDCLPIHIRPKSYTIGRKALYPNGAISKYGLTDLYPSEESMKKYPLDAYSAWMEWKELRKPKRWRAERGEKY